MAMVRKQLFITEEQNRRLKALASVRGVPEADIVRDGISAILTEAEADEDDWRTLPDRLTGAWAERENIHEEMAEVRRSWNRRGELLDAHPEKKS